MICNSCGKRIPPKADRCPHCGAPAFPGSTGSTRPWERFKLDSAPIVSRALGPSGMEGTCKACGAWLPEDAAFCEICGTPVAGRAGKTSGTAGKVSQESELWSCPECGSTHSTELTRCPICDHPQPGATPPDIQSSAGQENERKCPHCGSPNEPGSPQCTVCGKTFDGKATPADCSCPTCGAATKPDGIFCPVCGELLDVEAAASGSWNDRAYGFLDLSSADKSADGGEPARYCVVCGGPLTAGYEYCPMCGAKIERTQDDISDREPGQALTDVYDAARREDARGLDERSTSATRSCPECGAPLDESAVHCESCGWGFASRKERLAHQKRQKRPRKKQNAMRIWGTVLTILGGVLLLAALYAHATFEDLSTASRLIGSHGPQMASLLSAGELGGLAGLVLIVNGLILLFWSSRGSPESEGRHAAPEPRSGIKVAAFEIICALFTAAAIWGVYVHSQRQILGTWLLAEAPDSWASIETAAGTRNAPAAMWLGYADNRPVRLFVLDNGLRESNDLSWKPVNGFCTHWFWLLENGRTIATLSTDRNRLLLCGGNVMDTAAYAVYDRGSQAELTDLSNAVAGRTAEAGALAPAFLPAN